MAEVASTPKPSSSDMHVEDEVPAGEPVCLHRMFHVSYFEIKGCCKDETLEAMKARVEQMEREAAQLRDMQAGGYTHAALPTPAAVQVTTTATVLPESDAMETDEDKEASDSRSVYVGNVCRMYCPVQPYV